MSLYAVEEIDDALERTKNILLPFELSKWTKLAIITFFLGGTGFSQMFLQFPMSMPSGSYESASGGMTGMVTAMAPGSTAALAGIAALLFAGLMLLIYAKSAFEFVMFCSIREKDVAILRNLRKHYIDGFKYFLFQITIFLIMATAFLGLVSMFAVYPILGMFLVLPAIPVYLVLVGLSWVVHDFVLQEVIAANKGFIPSIQDSIVKITKDWREFGAYLIFRMIIAWAIAIMLMFVVMGVTAVIGIPFAVLIILALATPIHLLAWIVGIIGVLTWIVALLYASVPFKVYMYSYFVEMYDEFTM